ncbi:VRR-NUC domain-containing protein [Arthrobacter sp. PsM3]|uniref:VRR-NUC domain-containing protein n=1 Tax=Arthrobacter sp. PsM3 TaxID=3030531 RepID=UPI00263A625E|nr:VRR-NUC domain-containing protein [Arthrobacter sp. PsM3]MDN4645375.1 VRR-NUC domain-containing protein [Arthrobacter sp. PsM3]
MPSPTAFIPKLSEEQFQQQVIDLAQYHQYEVTYHNPDSRRSQAGFPDLVLISSSRRRALFRELKTEDGRVRPKQQAVLLAMVAAGLDADVWRPSDLRSGRIGKEMKGQA